MKDLLRNAIENLIETIDKVKLKDFWQLDTSLRKKIFFFVNLLILLSTKFTHKIVITLAGKVTGSKPWFRHSLKPYL